MERKQKSLQNEFQKKIVQLLGKSAPSHPYLADCNFHVLATGILRKHLLLTLFNYLNN